MVVSGFFAMINGLVDLLGGNEAVFQVGGVSYTVYDGAPVSEQYPDNFLIVGWDGDADGDWVAGLPDQDWAGIGTKRRDEIIEIPCCVKALYGDGDRWRACRDRAEAILGDIETKLRDHPDLGLAIDGVRQVITAEFKPVAMYQLGSSETGFEFVASFSVRVKTRT